MLFMFGLKAVERRTRKYDCRLGKGFEVYPIVYRASLSFFKKKPSTR